MAEVPLIIAARMDAGAFLTRLAVFLVVGLLAYANWLYHAVRGGELNRHSYPILGHYVRFGTVSCSVTLAAVVALIVLHRIRGHEPASARVVPAGSAAGGEEP